MQWQEYFRKRGVWQGRVRVLFQLLQGGTVIVQGLQARCGQGVALVGNVVGSAGKPVNGLYGRSQAFGQQNGSHREIFVMINARVHG